MSPYGWGTTAEEVAQDYATEIANKTILITGTSPNSLGAGFAAIVAKYHPRLIILASRNASRASDMAKAITAEAPNVQTRVLDLDLGSLDNVRKAAAEVNSYDEPIDVLVNSAGLMATPYELTSEGLEVQFGTNHIGHFLFTNLVMPKLLASASGGRIVSVSSEGYNLGPIRFHDWGFNVRNMPIPRKGYFTWPH